MRRIAIFLLLAALLSVWASAAELQDELSETIGADTLENGLDEEQRALMGDAAPTKSSGFFQTVQELLSRAVLHTGGYLKSAAGTAAMVLAVCLACGLCGTMEQSLPVQAVTIGGLLAITAICTSGVGSLIRLGTDTVHSLAAYAELLLPVLSAASVTAGAVTSAPVLYGITVLFSDLLLSLVTNALMPLLYVFLAMALADCILGNSTLKRFRELLAWIVKTGLKTVLYVFTGFLAVSQVISGTADAMTAKAAKLTLSSVVPVVGGIISDASETLLVSAALLKNSVGIFGMLAVLAICILPFLKIGMYFLVMRLTAAIAGTIAQDALVSMVDAVAEALGMLLAMTGACALLLLISSVCSLKAVGY